MPALRKICEPPAALTRGGVLAVGAEFRRHGPRFRQFWRDIGGRYGAASSKPQPGRLS